VSLASGEARQRYVERERSIRASAAALERVEQKIEREKKLEIKSLNRMV
jgi:hypothetical protein